MAFNAVDAGRDDRCGRGGCASGCASSTGILAAASGPVEVTAMGNAATGARRIDVGARIRPGDEIATLPGVRAQVMMRDGTTFAIGERARLVIDEYAYDPKTGRGALGAVIRRGSFRFVSGRIAKTSPGNVKLLQAIRRLPSTAPRFWGP